MQMIIVVNAYILIMLSLSVLDKVYVFIQLVYVKLFST